ncbi:MAG: tRNA epoxyqueuosine(34) reductase QueG [Phoenicibacter congonensis]|uniref:Epoxyqueuosine reductase n=1 Tax=Phoenicibacter congonensis TaxID=1944646 RepID=A0AA43UBM1_9ACTN|nr:tRNA epoxyqueuosine(34) reductase QueG [Phoenicibacter congonensis]
MDEKARNRMESDSKLSRLVEKMRVWATELGFAELRVSDIQIDGAEERLTHWLSEGYHGEMHYMAAHGLKRCHPEQIVPGTVRVVSVRMDYLPGNGPQVMAQERQMASRPSMARVSLYARGRDYHRVLRSRLQELASRIEAGHGPFGYRVFTDSAPVMEVALAAQAGIGWRGKNDLLVSRQAGTFFFLGEILVDLPLPVDVPETSHCGGCRRCLQSCPTGAIVAPRTVDARRCISYLTIELRGSIPVELRPLIGNRIYGCDDCQLCCPWNRFAKKAAVPDFAVRHQLDDVSLVGLASWTEDMFYQRMAGSPIRRIGYECWCRNLAVAMGNALSSQDESIDRQAVRSALEAMGTATGSDMVKEHISWALAQGGLAWL